MSEAVGYVGELNRMRAEVESFFRREVRKLSLGQKYRPGDIRAVDLAARSGLSHSVVLNIFDKPEVVSDRAMATVGDALSEMVAEREAGEVCSCGRAVGAGGCL